MVRCGWFWFGEASFFHLGEHRMAKSAAKLEVLSGVSNGGMDAIETSIPYNLKVGIEGAAPILFHAWNCESVDAKSKAAKNSKAKKSDDVESYVYRNDKGEICIPG